MLKLARVTKTVLADRRPGTAGTILEHVLLEEDIVFWIDLIPFLREELTWENHRIENFFRWLDEFLPYLNANGKVDVEALGQVLILSDRQGIKHIVNQADERTLEPADRLARNIGWLVKLFRGKRIPNGEVEQAVMRKITLERDQRQLIEILSIEGVVTLAGIVSANLLRTALLAYDFNLTATYDRALLKRVKAILAPKSVSNPGISRPKQSTTPPTPKPVPPVLTGLVEVIVISRKLAMVHQSLLVLMDVLVRDKRWTGGQDLLPAFLVWAMLRHFWPKARSHARFFDQLEDAGLVVWKKTGKTSAGDYPLFHVPRSPLVTIRASDNASVKALDSRGALSFALEAFRTANRDSATEHKLLAEALRS